MNSEPVRKKKDNIIEFRKKRKLAEARFKPQQWGESIYQHTDFSNISDLVSKEWMLTDHCGGYSSSTIPNLNTRKYHGLLVYSQPGLIRRLVLNKYVFDIELDKEKIPLSTNQYDKEFLDSKINYLKNFELDHDTVSYTLDSPLFTIKISHNLLKGLNTSTTQLELTNKSQKQLSLKIYPLTNSRSIHELTKQNDRFTQKSITPHDVSITTDEDYVFIYSKDMNFHQDTHWHKNIYYQLEDQRGEDCLEDCFVPGYFQLKTEPGSTKKSLLSCTACLNEKQAANYFKQVVTHKSINKPPHSEGVFTLMANNNAFLVNAYNKMTVIAGYHWFNDWGRDALISLPGLCLINKKYAQAEKIFEHFLNNIKNGFTPTKFVDGQPQYYDFDGGLWLIDRLKKYVELIGKPHAKKFLHTYWWDLKDVITHYSKHLNHGILGNQSGTWMDTLKRNSAVEIQGLWYNALKSMESFGTLMADEIDYSQNICAFEKNFMDKYWVETHFKDCETDTAIRPNQAILLSMDYCIVEPQKAIQTLDAITERLLTPYGLRTLDPQDERYCGKYEGDWATRENAYHNGTVWPWLLGPYFKALRQFKGQKECEKIWDITKPLITTHLWEAGLGYVSEIFDGNPPHKPRGCIAQAWSMAELSRAFTQDISR